MKSAVVVNPHAGQGKCQRRWDALQPVVRETFGPVKFCPTDGPGHAAVLARALLNDGYEHIISAGGDGTHFDVLNGWFDNDVPLNPEARLTPLAMGTGSDLVRSLGIVPGRRGIESLRDAGTVRADVGCLTCSSESGSPPRTLYFLNLVHIGLGAAACRYVNEHTKAPGGFLSYLRAILATITTYRARDIAITIDRHVLLHEPTLDFSIANGRYDAGGLLMAPRARLDNGLFDCHHIGPVGLLDALRTLPKLYAGRLSERRDIVTYLRGSTIEARSDETTELEADGEFVGYLPATITLLPGAIRLTTAKSDV